MDTESSMLSQSCYSFEERQLLWSGSEKREANADPMVNPLTSGLSGTVEPVLTQEYMGSLMHTRPRSLRSGKKLPNHPNKPRSANIA
jgi:hypothetical protein